MGKKTIISFIYDGDFDWYVRIPHSNTQGVCTAYNYNHKYLLAFRYFTID